jgi:hypothetical protein
MLRVSVSAVKRSCRFCYFGSHVSFVCLLVLQAVAPRNVSGVTLSDNLGASTYYTELIGGSNDIAAAFRTDGSSYTLDSVTALMKQDQAGGLALSLYTNAIMQPVNDLGSQPGTLLGVLSSPASYPMTLGAVTFGGSNLSLSPDSTYWLVMSAPKSGGYEWAYAAGNNGTGVGFYPSWGTSNDGGQSWYTDDLQPMQMSVTADVATPEPNLCGLMLLGFGLVAPALKARISQRRIA